MSDERAEEVEDAGTWTRRGAALQKEGRFREAVEANDRALALDPRAFDALFNRANCRRRLGDPAAAERDLDAYVAARPEDPDGWLWRGVARRDQKKLGAALEDMDRAAAMKPDLALAFYHRGVVRRDRGDAAGCRVDLAEAVRLDPGLEADVRSVLDALPPPAAPRGRGRAVLVMLVLAALGGGFLWFRSHEKTEAERSAFEALAATKGTEPVERFLSDWPDGAHAEAARSLLDHREFARAREAGTVAAYGEYTDRWPEGQHLQEAYAAIEEEETWRDASVANDTWPFEQYLAKYPTGRHADEAKDGIDAVNAFSLDDVAAIRAYLAAHPSGRAAARARAVIEDEDAWARARREDTRASAQEYLEKHPEGRHAEDARGALAWLEAREADTVEAYRAWVEAHPDDPRAELAWKVVQDEEAWASAVSWGNVAGYRSYRDRYPAGRHAREVGPILADEEAFESASKAGTAEALEGYLRRFPTGRRTEAARFLAALAADPRTLSGPIASGEVPDVPVLRFAALLTLDEYAYVTVSEQPYPGVQVLVEVRLYCRALLAPKEELAARADRLRAAHRELSRLQALGAGQDPDAYNTALHAFQDAAKALPEGLKTALVQVPRTYAPKLQEKVEEEVRRKNLGMTGMGPIFPPGSLFPPPKEEDPVLAQNRELMAKVQGALDAVAEVLRVWDAFPRHSGTLAKPDDEFRGVTGDWRSLLGEDRLVVDLGVPE